MKRYCFYILLILLFSSFSHANGNKFVSLEKIKTIKCDDKFISAIIDFTSNKVIINKLNVPNDIPIGRIQLDFLEPISIPIKGKEIKDNEIIIKASDWYDGIGTDIEISFFINVKTATIKLMSQFEETSFTFVPQLIPYEITNK